jgi:hypothetical protein
LEEKMQRIALAVLGVLLAASASAHGSGGFANHGVSSAPFAERSAISRPSDIIAAPVAHRGAQPDDIIAAPVAHLPGVGPLVKPAWME